MNQSDLFPPPAPDFSDPLALLRACHDRILRHCDLLERAAERMVSEGGSDTEAKSALLQVQRYFSSAGKHHHQDEEQELFPRLARQSLKLADLIHRLRQDHEAMEQAWQQLQPQLLTPTKIEDLAAFQQLAIEFAELHRRHVEIENSELLEMASHIISSSDLRKIGRNMAERRGAPISF